MSDDVAIRIEGLWKRYGLPLPAVVRKGLVWLRRNLHPQHALSHAEGSKIPDPCSAEHTSPGRNPQSNDGPWALRDIDIEVRRGEVLGIIGRNGAGKSTLLKALAGVTPCTLGRVEVRGSVFPMIELNAGIHPELTGLENVYLLGAIMGLSWQEVRVVIQEIVDFSELGEWMNKPVRMYSSGMLTRLGFSVAMNVSADILLIDEVLAVGDLQFQRRCFDRIEKLRSSGVTILFVSHNIRQIQRICSRAILMDEGGIFQRGSATEIANAFYSDSVKAHSRYVKQILSKQRGNGEEVMIASVSVYNENSELTDEIVSGRSLRVDVEFNVREQIENAYVNLNMRTSDFVFLACQKAQAIRLPARKSTLTWRFQVLHLLPGTYILSTTLKDSNNRYIVSDGGNRVLTVLPNRFGTNIDGLVNLPTEWQLTVNRTGNKKHLIASGRWDTST